MLVTGANGFAGAAICRHLVRHGWQVRACVRNAAAAVPEGVEKVVVGEIGEATDWSAALAGVDAVVHCAARVHVLRETAADPLTAFRRVNVDGSRELAVQAAAAGVRRFVFLSSIGAAVAERQPAAASPYQRSKLEAEAALREAAARSGMVLVMLRPPLIYGPGAPGNFRRLARLVAAGRPLPLAAIDNKRSLLFIGNLAGAVEAALRCDTAPEGPLALCDGEDLSTPELARRIGRACGRPARLFAVPALLLKGAGRLFGRSAGVAALTGSLTVDNGPIRKSLGWSPDFSVEEGLTMTFRDTPQDAAR
ncbi:NAD-dependent epimerase/dehydratase family protein [Pelagibius sp. CAU 1746]|uniref:NAD-dependent epimerase/dehydratase family protein n=1 Tax=Pelagibius sp. CAU 1746 TaxID=3140370 RepID=UPI00325A82D3